MPRVVFAAPYLPEATLRFALAAAEAGDVRLGLVTHEPVERVPAALRERLAAHWRVDDALDPEQLEGGVRELARVLGGVDRLVGVLEQLQVPLAQVRERLGLPGMSVETARNFRDKARMKTVLRQAGLPCARHHLTVTLADGLEFADRVGYPLVVKPPAGAGAQATYRVDGREQLEQILGAAPPSPERPVLIEEHVTGRERSFDAVIIRGEPVWHSISHYLPTPLEVLRNPWIQWCVLLPREIGGPPYDAIREAGFRALKTLGLETGLSHMEWFELTGDRLAVSEVAARPPGAQITSLISLAHDFDLYRAWTRLMIHDRFEPPSREFAAGAAFLRGQGGGRRVVAVHGIEAAQRELGDLVMEAKLPQPGQSRSPGYEGEGYVLLRHPETAVVERALARLLELLRVETG